MLNFALIEIDSIKGNQKFFKLKKDDKIPFDEFVKDALENYKIEVLKIYALMDLVANNKTLPNTKFKVISNKGDKPKEYEFKTKHLRVYAIHDEHTGKIIITGGYKNEQQQDINKFRNLKQLYLKWKEDEKRRTN